MLQRYRYRGDDIKQERELFGGLLDHSNRLPTFIRHSFGPVRTEINVHRYHHVYTLADPIVTSSLY
jgi:hypothetical protein